MFVTPLYASLLTFWYLLLSAAVIRERARGVSLGDGGDPNMLRVIRGHANFAEYVPLALLLLGILELSHVPVYVLHGLGLLLLGARLLHGYALSFTPRWRFGRVWGTALTFLVLFIEAALCLAQAYRGQTLWMHGL